MSRRANRQNSQSATVSPATSAQAPIREIPPWLLCGVLLVAVLAVYIRATGFDFIDLDDATYVTANPHVLSGLSMDGLRNAFSFSDSSYFHPFTWLSLMLDVTLYGTGAGGFHLTNVLLHAVNVALLFSLVLRLVEDRWVALAVAGLFGLHPVHVEAVAWVTARKDVLSTLFGLCALHCYVGWTKNGGRRMLLLSLAAHAASLLSKPMLVTLPGLLLLLDLWPLRRADGPGVWPSFRRMAVLVLEKWPFLLLGLASGLITLSSHPNAFGGIEHSLGLRLANALVSYMGYLRLLVLPFDLAVLYPFPDSLPAWRVIGSGVLLVVMTALAVLQWPRRPYLLVGWLWYIMALVPIIVAPRLGMHVALADRWAYVPSLGIYLAVVLLAATWIRSWQTQGIHKGFVLAICLLPYAAMAALSWHQLGFWRDKFTVYERALDVTSGNYYIVNNYGVLMLRKGNFAVAERHFRMAHELYPDHPIALANLGQVYMFTKRFSEAIPMYERALEADLKAGGPIHDDYYGLGYCLARLGRLGEAEALFRKILEIKPDYVIAYNDLGNIAVQRGNLREAEEHYAKAVQLVPGYAVARENLSRVRARLNAGG